jgi:hypothetical protein
MPVQQMCQPKKKPKKAMVEHIWKNGFTPGYTRWIFHGEAHRTREEVLRQCVEDYDVDAGVADMLNDYQEAQYTGGCMDVELEPTGQSTYPPLPLCLRCEQGERARVQPYDLGTTAHSIAYINSRLVLL